MELICLRTSKEMSSVAKAPKAKRRIVPVHLPTEIKPAAAAPQPSAASRETVAIHSMAPSTYHQEFLDYAGSKEYIKELEKRAVEKGYAKEKKPRAPRAPRPQAVDHGDHGQHLSDFNQYALELLKLKQHTKGQTLFEYLKKQFDAGRYYSTGSRRFRRVGSGGVAE